MSAYGHLLLPKKYYIQEIVGIDIYSKMYLDKKKMWLANIEVSVWTCFSLLFNCGHVQLVVGKRKQIDQCRVILCKKFVYIMTHGWMRTCLSNCTGNINLLLFTKQPCCPAEDVWSQENASKMQNSNSCGPRLSGFNMYFFSGKKILDGWLYRTMCWCLFGSLLTFTVCMIV